MKRYLPSILAFVWLSGLCFGQGGIISTVAGSDPIRDGGPAIQGLLESPAAITFDTSGNLYIADYGNNRIRKVTPAGIITTVAGNGQGFSGDGGPTTEAQFFQPRGVAVDTLGNLYIADTGNHRVRRATPAGAITTVAGNGVQGYSGDGGPAAEAQLFTPMGIAVDAAGNLYIADYANNRIRKVTPAGVITTVAGNAAQGYGGDGGPATAAQLYTPMGVAVDGAGNLYIADYGNARIRKVTPAGIITTLAGTGVQGYSGDGGPATEAQIYFPPGVALDAAGYLYIVDSHRIRRVTPAGIITTVAGTGVQGYSGDGGPATQAQLSSPQGVAVDAPGALYIADRENFRIRKVTPPGTITTVAGGWHFGGDGTLAAGALLHFPTSVAFDNAGNFYIADSGNNRIRKVTPGGLISTVAGNGTNGFGGDGGPATAAQLSLGTVYPSAIVLDAAGNLYIADYGNNRIRKVTPAGIITTIAGNGVQGYRGDGGAAASAQLFSPTGLAVDSVGNLYIADPGNSRIRKVTPAGIIDTFAGNGVWGYSGDGGLAVIAQISYPAGLALDSAGNLYIADTSFHRIRRISPAGIISTVAGPENGLHLPRSVAVDAAGNLYIADPSNNRICKLTPGGLFGTVAGNGMSGFSGDGGLATAARLFTPEGVAVDASGNLYIADTWNQRIRFVSLPQTQFSFFPQVAVGGGYSTLFTFTNTGATPASGTLTLTDSQGNPLTVSGELSDPFAAAQSVSTGEKYAAAGASFAFIVPSGGTLFLSANPLGAGDPQKRGWARLESLGGAFNASGTFQYVDGGSVQTIASVLQSQPLQFATIPLNNDDSQDQFTGYAIANPGGESISIKLAVVNQSGAVVNDTVTISLGPGQQIARFLHQDLALLKFRGSMVFRGQGRSTFVAVALLQKQSRLTVIPVTPEKALNVPN